MAPRAIQGTKQDACMRLAATALTNLLLMLFPAAAGAREQSAAIFDLELTDESWTRTLDWLVRNRLLDNERGVPQ